MFNALRLTIRVRLLLLGFFSVGSTLALLLILAYLSGQIEHLKDGESLLQRTENQVLRLRQLEKDFSVDRHMSEVAEFQSDARLLNGQLAELQPFSQKVGLSSELVRVGGLLQRYEEAFMQTVAGYQVIGLTQDEGLRYALRSAVHKAEAVVRELQQDHLLVSILMLRRHEKDFLLRHQDKYLKRFAVELTHLKEMIESSPVVSLQGGDIFDALSVYGREFTALVGSWETLGLKSNDGLRGGMAKSAKELERSMADMVQQFTVRLAARIDTIRQTILIVSVLMTLGLLALLASVGYSILRPLREVSTLVQNLSEHDGDLTMRLNFANKDELGVLADNIDQFTAKTHRIVTQIAERVGVVTDSAQQGASIAEQTSQGVVRQQHEIEQMSGSVHGLAGTAAHVAEYAENAAQLAESARVKVEQSEGSMSASVGGIQSLTEEVNNAARVLSQLAEDSRNISSIVSVIRDVSEQTNLLALNAAIEAARAGDQGRGFAVVADEVRSLAVKTHDSTEQINEFIRQLQERSEHAVTVMQRGTEQSSRCIEQSEQAASQLEEVVQSILSINQITGQILEGASDQQQVAAELDRNMRNMKEVALEVAEGARQTNDDSLHLNSLAAELTHQVQKFRF